MTSKTCGNCGETKTHAEFHKHSRQKDGLQPWCKTCMKAKAAEQKVREAESGVYILECPMAAESYVGSTTQGLAKRLRLHRTRAFSISGSRKPASPVVQCLRQFADKGYWRIRWLAKMPDATTEELLAMEQNFINDLNPTLNRRAALKEVA